VERLSSHGCGQFAVLHGQHSMISTDGSGVPESETNLACLELLRQRYRVPVGFIDHTSNPMMPIIAAMRGASIVTKHLALSRALKGADWHICLEPTEMAHTIRQVRIAESTLGKPDKLLGRSEMIDRSEMRRSIVAARKLTAGTALQRDDLRFKRPGTGLSPRRAPEIVGRVLTIDLEEDEQLRLEHLK